MTFSEGMTVFWVIFGLFFFIVGVVGVIRLPDAYSRLHASGKVATMGLFGVLIGMMFSLPGSVFKLILLGVFMAIAAPVASHAIAKADRDYTELQRVARDSSISAEGAQDHPEETAEAV